ILYCCTLPFFSASALLFATIFLLLGSIFSFKKSDVSLARLDLLALLALAVIPLCAFVRACLIELDPYLAVSFIFHNFDPLGYLLFIGQNSRHLFQGAIDLCGMAIMVLVALQIKRISSFPSFNNSIYWGIVFSSLLAAFFTFAQVFAIDPFFLRNQT